MSDPRTVVDLSGQWDLVFDDKLVGRDQEWFLRYPAKKAVKMAVPGVWETIRPFFDGVGWYRTTFEAPREWKEKSVRVKFGAAAYLAEVWLNGKSLGIHEGGYSPFEFEIARKLHVGTNELIVRLLNPPLRPRAGRLPRRRAAEPGRPALRQGRVVLQLRRALARGRADHRRPGVREGRLRPAALGPEEGGRQHHRPQQRRAAHRHPHLPDRLQGRGIQPGHHQDLPQAPGQGRQSVRRSGQVRGRAPLEPHRSAPVRRHGDDRDEGHAPGRRHSRRVRRPLWHARVHHQERPVPPQRQKDQAPGLPPAGHVPADAVLPPQPRVRPQGTPDAQGQRLQLRPRPPQAHQSLVPRPVRRNGLHRGGRARHRLDRQEPRDGAPLPREHRGDDSPRPQPPLDRDVVPDERGVPLPRLQVPRDHGHGHPPGQGRAGAGPLAAPHGHLRRHGRSQRDRLQGLPAPTWTRPPRCSTSTATASCPSRTPPS